MVSKNNETRDMNINTIQWSLDRETEEMEKNMMHSNVAVCDFENMWYGFQNGY